MRDSIARARILGASLALAAVVTAASAGRLESNERSAGDSSDRSEGRDDAAAQAPRAPERRTLRVSQDTAIDLVYIKPGQFTMGRRVRGELLGALINFEASEGIDESPPRRVRITRGFYVGKYKVTCEQFCLFLNDVDGAGEYVALNTFARIERTREGKYVPKPGCEECAVSTVPWQGAQAFCDWLSRKTGQTVRLPTEAEWEFTARGAEDREYPWGKARPENTPLLDRMRNKDQYPHRWSCKPVDAFPQDATPTGVTGMSGWVGEWCSDYYGVRYLAEDTVDPQGPSRDQLPVKSSNPLIATVAGEYRVLRGVSARTMERAFSREVQESGIYGLRIVVEAEEATEGDGGRERE
jgi:formylglycine-generating enzyme required for sulfatase activity